MHILILNWRDTEHPLAGGAEISLLQHAKYWRAKGADVTWFASSFDGAPAVESRGGLRVIRRGSQYTVHLWAWYYYVRKRFGHVDLVIDNFHFIPFFAPMYMRGVRVMPLVQEVAKEVWFDNICFPLACVGYCLESWFFVPYTRRRFITCSASTKTDLMRLGIPERNVSVIHHGITRPAEPVKQKKAARPTALFLNRISEDKGIRDVLQVFSDLQDTEPLLQLRIAGKEEKPGMLRDLLRNAGLEGNPNIEYLGYVAEREKYSLLASAWILLHPSRREGWGLTVIEAAAMKTPTVGYDVAGLRDSIIHNVTGILTPDRGAMTTAVRDLLSDDVKRRRMGESAGEWSEQFDWERSGSASWSLIRSA